MKHIEKDIVIIGTGTAGLAAYRAAKTHTPSVILIESGEYGTTCARVGCMPSKLLIAAAEAAHEAAHTEPFGILVDKVQVDPEAVMARVRSERDRFVGFVTQSVDTIDHEDKIRGTASFANGRTVLVEQPGKPSLSIDFKAAVIATGSRASYPNFFKNAEDRLIINDDVFEWKTLPKSVAVFGPGVIGLELGQALSRLNVDVSLFGVGGGIGPLTDPILRSVGHKIYGQDFSHYQPDSKVTSIQRVSDGVLIKFEQNGKNTEIIVDYVLAATGRRPNVDNLGLANIALPLDSNDVPIADPTTMQVGQSSIFIAGDASNQIPLLHEATDQGKIAGDNAGRLVTTKTLKSGLRRSPIGIVFSDPQIAMVGQNFQSLKSKINDNCIAIGEVSFADQGRSRVMLKNKGYLRLYAEHGTGLFLGAEMVGPRAEHIAHLLAWAHQQKMTIEQMLDMPFYHPVIEEGLRTALRSALAELKMGVEIRDRCAECGVGS